MEYDILFSDYDNTLYGEDKTVSEKTKNYIRRYTENGGIFVISTGRIYGSIRNIALELGLNGDIICSQGSEIYSLAEDKNIYTYPLIKPKAVQIMQFALDNGCVPQFYFDNKIYLTDNDEINGFYRDFFKAELVENDDIMECVKADNIKPNKIEIVTPAESMNNVIKSLEVRFPEFLFSKSAPFMIEVVDRNATKGRAVRYLLDKYNIPIERAAAIGDGNNDIDMIEAAGLGVAVKNSARRLLSVADYICKDAGGDGVGEIIEKLLSNTPIK